MACARLGPETGAAPKPLAWEPVGPDYPDEITFSSLAALLKNIVCRTLQVKPLYARSALP